MQIIILTAPTAGLFPKAFDLYSATYMLFTQPRSWQDAADACGQFGLTLPTIYSAEHANEINGEVRKHIASTALYWIGAYDAGSEGQWKWADNSTGNLGASGVGPNSWNPWATGQPSGSTTENCVAVGGGTSSVLWGDARCSDQYAYVCTLPGRLQGIAQRLQGSLIHQRCITCFAGSGSASYSLVNVSMVDTPILVKAKGALDGYCLTTSSTSIVLKPCMHNQPQQFKYTSQGSLVHIPTGLCMTVSNAATAYGTQVILASCSSVPQQSLHQQWRLDDKGALRPRHAMYASRCLFVNTTTTAATIQSCQTDGLVSWMAGE
jgi:hypothetical protein